MLLSKKSLTLVLIVATVTWKTVALLLVVMVNIRLTKRAHHAKGERHERSKPTQSKAQKGRQSSRAQTPQTNRGLILVSNQASHRELTGWMQV